MPLIAIGVVLLVGLAVGGLLRLTAGDDDGSPRTPSPQDLPRNVVAVVVDAPEGTGTISREELEHAIDVAAASAGKPVPKPGNAHYDDLKESSLSELLDSIWLQGQAAEMGFEATPGQVAAELKKIKKQSFDSEKQYHEFLEESHYTPADVDGRVKVQVLSSKIQGQIEGEASAPSKREIEDYYSSNRDAQFTNPTTGRTEPLATVRTQIRTQLLEQAKQDAFAGFVKRYTNRWRSRTVCAPGFVDDEKCSNGKRPPQEGEPKAADDSTPPGSTPP